MLSFLLQIKSYLIALGLAILGGIGLYLKGRSAGRANLEAKQNAKTINDISKATKAREEVRRTPADDRPERLRKFDRP